MSAPEMSQKVARELVETIADDHGYVPESIWKALKPEHRETLQRKMRNLENIAGTAISTLAKNLYTSDARFVFELLQNAEDNSFTNARNSHSAPYVSFEVYPDQIIIECNEDGFQPENLKAICAVGKSSKSGAQKGYVGEKGIGFKSVFMAAWKVHIESGPFSFFFKHKKGDQGLGMITPVWGDTDDDDETYPGTRMVLELGDGYGPISSSQYQIILDQFNSLKENNLLFMRNIEEIRIYIFDNDKKLRKSNIFSRERIDENLIRLTQISETASKVESSSRDYYIFKHTVGGLDKNEIRTYSEYEEENKTYASAEIVLGFPLTEESVPIVEYQEIFTFLPMKQAGFTFLINSDFVTQANRQDIVMTSGRNIGIRRGIADAFIQAALEFCDHPKLQYTWMRFLPEKKQHFDPFWSQLVTLLEKKLDKTAILRPRSEDSFRLISSLRYSVESQLDCRGEPLFRDNDPEMHISKRYSKDDIMILRSYGLTEYTASEILDAISFDLNTSDSRMKSKDRDDDWHSRSANYLKSILLSSNTILHAKLRSLQLLPLQDGTWIAAESQETFLPEANGLEVPPALDLNIIDSEATQNAHRRQLFSLLGAKEAEISFLRRRILERKLRTKFTREGVAQLRYMFLTDKHRHRSEDTGNIWLVDSETYFQNPFSTDIYMPDDKPFGPSKLLEDVEDTDGLSVHFLHPLWLNQVFQKSDEAMQLSSWKDWLCSYAGVRRHLRIISKEDRGQLSKECLYVADHHADKLLGFLNYTWGQESKDITTSPVLVQKLKEIKAPCQNGRMVALGATWLPLLGLQNEWRRFSRAPEGFPFLKMDREITRDSYARDWGFLASHLSVGVDDSISFYLSILLNIIDGQPGDEDDINESFRILELYGVIYGKYLECANDINKKLIRDFIDTNKLIYVPPSAWQDSCQMSSEDCVWEGPETLTMKAPLQARYKAMPIKNLSSVASFMTDVLGIGNCDEDIICAQIVDLSRFNEVDFDRLKNLYSSLWDLLRKKKPGEARKLMKSKFADKAPIYTPSDDCWNKISECLWSSATTIRSKKVLEPDYKEMRSFFVDILGVQTLNLGLIYNELTKLGESKPTVELVKEQLFAFNDHFHTIMDYKEIKPDGMRKLKILPIRQPGVQQTIHFCDGNTEFAIADTCPLEDNFRQKVKTLGITFDELHLLGPIIKWLGLEERYLSRLVTETSKVEDDDRVLNHSLTRTIESRAHALCRIAKHFNSPRWRTTEELHNLYYLLKQAKVFETDNISCVQIVQQGGQSYYHEISRSKFHLEEGVSSLDIFVPREKKSQALCLARDLPARLFEWMTTSDSAKNHCSSSDRSHSLVKDILKEDSDIYNQILLEEGIVDVIIEDEDASDEEDSVSTRSASEEAFELSDSTEIGSNMATPLTDMSSPRMDFDHDEILATVVHQDTISSHVASSQNITRLFVQQTSSHASGERIEVPTSMQREATSVNLGYPELLSHVVSSARRASIPMKGSFDMDALRESLPSSSAYNSNIYGIDSYGLGSAGSLSQLERDKMIGAAGELYIFELLKACSPSLPDFGIDNWKSKIRWYAQKHPEYATMQPWHGRETSDVVYHDKMGTFTKLLIDNCYFDASTWEHRRPTYHFEVKTTVSSCETRFFVSKNQYKMLHDNRGKEDSVYIIMRVFNVGNGNIGLRLYIDPAELEAREELLFTAETWSVVPGA